MVKAVIELCAMMLSLQLFYSISLCLSRNSNSAFIMPDQTSRKYQVVHLYEREAVRSSSTSIAMIMLTAEKMMRTLVTGGDFKYLVSS